MHKQVRTLHLVLAVSKLGDAGHDIISTAHLSINPATVNEPREVSSIPASCFSFSASL